MEQVRGDPSEGRFTTWHRSSPGVLTLMAEEPPPSRLMTVTQPWASSSSAHSFRDRPLEWLLFRPSTTVSWMVPSAWMPSRVRGLRPEEMALSQEEESVRAPSCTRMSPPPQAHTARAAASSEHWADRVTRSPTANLASSPSSPAVEAAVRMKLSSPMAWAWG